MKFALFLLVNAMLFIRPAEFAPELYGLPIYEVCILSCLLFSYPLVLAQFRLQGLIDNPINGCVIGLLPAIVLSHLANAQPGMAFDSALEFFKLLLYYALLVSLVDTPAKLQRLLLCLSLCAAFITLLSVLQYHGMVQIEALKFVEEHGAENTGGSDDSLRRLGSTGLFADPNDMCLMLVMSLTISLYQIVEHRRFVFIPLLLLFGHALTLTNSRGGLIGMMIALTAILFARFGRKAMPLGVLVFPLVLAAFGGRQTEISLNGGTGQSRVQLWAAGMSHFIKKPIFGIGSDRYAEIIDHVAHNSFIHAFTELGFVGGTLFLGAFYLAFWTIIRLGGRDVPPLRPELRKLRPYILGIVAGYAGGLFSLSNNYTIPTYTVIGLAAVYIRLAEVDLGVPVARFNFQIFKRLVLVGLCFLVAALVTIPVLLKVG